MRGSHLRFEKESRYYTLLLERNLLGEWCLMRVWGGCQSKAGNERLEYYGDYDEALKRLEYLANVRERRRGYKRVEKGSGS